MNDHLLPSLMLFFCEKGHVYNGWKIKGLKCTQRAPQPRAMITLSRFLPIKKCSSTYNFPVFTHNPLTQIK